MSGGPITDRVLRAVKRSKGEDTAPCDAGRSLGEQVAGGVR